MYVLGENMKKLSLLFILINLVLQAQDKPIFKWINPILELYFLYDIFFLNNSEGWCAGETSIAIKTTDGGLSWHYPNRINILR